MNKFKWPTPGILHQLNDSGEKHYNKLTFEMLESFIDRLQTESDRKISYEEREEIWRKIRLGLPLTTVEKLIHEYDLEVFKRTGKWQS